MALFVKFTARWGPTQTGQTIGRNGTIVVNWHIDWRLIAVATRDINGSTRLNRCRCRLCWNVWQRNIRSRSEWATFRSEIATASIVVAGWGSSRIEIGVAISWCCWSGQVKIRLFKIRPSEIATSIVRLENGSSIVYVVWRRLWCRNCGSWPIEATLRHRRPTMTRHQTEDTIIAQYGHTGWVRKGPRDASVAHRTSTDTRRLWSMITVVIMEWSRFGWWWLWCWCHRLSTSRTRWWWRSWPWRRLLVEMVGSSIAVADTFVWFNEGSWLSWWWSR